jgi:hypothetical protein
MIRYRHRTLRREVPLECFTGGVGRLMTIAFDIIGKGRWASIIFEALGRALCRGWALSGISTEWNSIEGHGAGGGIGHEM